MVTSHWVSNFTLYKNQFFILFYFIFYFCKYGPFVRCFFLAPEDLCSPKMYTDDGSYLIWSMIERNFGLFINFTLWHCNVVVRVIQASDFIPLTVQELSSFLYFQPMLLVYLFIHYFIFEKHSFNICYMMFTSISLLPFPFGELFIIGRLFIIFLPLTPQWYYFYVYLCLSLSDMFYFYNSFPSPSPLLLLKTTASCLHLRPFPFPLVRNEQYRVEMAGHATTFFLFFPSLSSIISSSLFKCFSKLSYRKMYLTFII